MKSLFLDTSNSNLILAIFDDLKQIYYFNEAVGNDLSIRVFSVIDDAFKTTKLKPNDIDTIFVATGPGSFTGVRIGVSIAKTYAWALKKKIIPVSSLEVLASTHSDNSYLVPIIDARRNCVYAGIYNNKLGLVYKDIYIDLDELKNKLSSNKYVFVSYDTNLVSENIISPDINLTKVISKHFNDNGVNPHALVPNYLKITEAEANLNKAKSND